MLYWLCEKSDRYPTWPQLEHVIRRNFGGLEDEHFVPLEEFKERMPNREIPDLTQIPPEVSTCNYTTSEICVYDKQRESVE
jgi:hypothetical protein